MKLKPEETALILIGFQNDYFSDNSILHSVIDRTESRKTLLSKTVELVKCLKKINVRVFHMPILFSRDYSELLEPVGLLGKIKEVGAFLRDSAGGKTVSEISEFGAEVEELLGKTNFNAFTGTELHNILSKNKIKNVAFAGIFTSICIDSSARASFEYKYKTFIISDCIGGRNDFENKYYCEEVFPLYSKLFSAENFIANLRFGK
jgi:nicotinamidase-related amidase